MNSSKKRSLTEVVNPVKKQKKIFNIALLPLHIQSRIAQYIIFNELNNNPLLPLYLSQTSTFGPYTVETKVKQLYISYNTKSCILSRKEEIVGDYAFSKNGAFLVFLSDCFSVNIIDLSNELLFKHFSDKVTYFAASAISSDGKKFAMLDNYHIWIFRVLKNQPKLSFNKKIKITNNENLYTIDFNKKGTHIGIYYKNDDNLSVIVKPIEKISTLQQCFHSMGICKKIN